LKLLIQFDTPKIAQARVKDVKMAIVFHRQGVKYILPNIWKKCVQNKQLITSIGQKGSLIGENEVYLCIKFYKK